MYRPQQNHAIENSQNHTHFEETRARLLLTATTAWRSIDAKSCGQAEEDAISELSAQGLIEVRIVAIVRMGDKVTPKCRYVGGGAWWPLLEAKLEQLVPVTWREKNGLPKNYLIQDAKVVSIRLTSAGYDYCQAIKNDTWREWIDARPNKIEPYLRCDGVAKIKQPAITTNDARDKWIYQKCVALVPYASIVRQLKEKAKWELIDSIQGIKLAAKRYAERNCLPPIPSRQPGRKKR